MRPEADVYAYVQDLEKHLQMTSFGGDGRSGRRRAAGTRRARRRRPGPGGRAGQPDAAAGHDHAGQPGCGGRRRPRPRADRAGPRRLAAGRGTLHGRAGPGRRAGGRRERLGRARRSGRATTLLSQAYALYEELGNDEDLARVRSSLRAAGTRLRHWSHADRPAFGWDSLTDTERRVTDLVVQGLSNRQVANRVFLSTHTVAFHLRHIFWKLGITSRVQLARIAAEQDTEDARSGQPAR